MKTLNDIREHIEKAAGFKIRQFPKDVQEDAYNEAVIAYLEGKDILRHLILWNRERREYNRTILTFTRARPLRREKDEIKEIHKGYF